MSKAASTEERQQKQINTKTNNNSFNTSKPEKAYYQKLLQDYPNKTIIPQYRDKERYPFNCDFYIVEDDLFIELNLHWTHGGRPYDPNNEDCQALLDKWRSKTNGSDFYSQAIYVWTKLDVKKQQTAKQNNLNYLAIY